MPRRANPTATRMQEPSSRRDPLFGTSADLKEIVELSLIHIRLDPNQPRKTVDEEGLRELAASIEREGLLQPITVRKDPEGDGYIIVAGERRFRAHQLLGRERIEAIIHRIDEKTAFRVALIENLQREDLTPFEEASGYAKLMEEFGYTQEEVADAVGKARPTVTKTLKLNDLPEKIRQEGATSHISKSLLLEVAHLPSEEEQLALWEDIKRGGTTVRTARERKQGKKIAPAAERATQSEVRQTISFGRSFARRLGEVTDEYLAANQADYAALMMLHRQVGERLDAARRAIGEPIEMPPEGGKA